MLAPSAFAHRYDLPDGTCAVYHALSLDCVFVGPDARPLFAPVWARDVPFPIPEGGVGDVRPDYPVPDPKERVSPEAWLAAARTSEERAERSHAVETLAAMHLLQQDGDAFDATWLQRLRALIDDNPMKMLTIVPTTLCNYRCTYCHESEASRSNPRRMTIAQCKALIEAWGRRARRAEGRKDVLLYGGEPLLAPDIVRHVVEHFASAPRERYGGQVCVVLVTNGSCLTDEWARFFKAHDTFVIVSCDALQEENDRARVTGEGHGTFERTERGYRMLEKAVVRAAISVTVGTHNAARIHETFGEVVARFNPLDIGLNSCLHPPYGQQRNEFSCTPLEGTRLMLDAYAGARGKGVYVEQFNRRVRPFALRKHRVKDCSACGGRIVAQPNGRWSFCDSFSFTDAYSYPFQGDFDLDQSADYERWARLSPLLWPGCRECPAVALCGGGCRYDAAMASGRIDGLDPQRCTQDREVLRWIIADFGRRVDAGKLEGTEILVPSEDARQGLVGKLTIDAQSIPLGNANRYGEKVESLVKSHAVRSRR